MLVKRVIIGCLAVLWACSESRAPSVPCRDGVRVEAAAGLVCVFRRDQPLVIEGGFSCPPDLAFRTDTPTAIACSEHELPALPHEVCAEVPDACESPADAAAPARPGISAAMQPNEGPTPPSVARCMATCATPDDCVPGPMVVPIPTHDQDNFACNDGLCVYLGCNDDDECGARSASAARCVEDRSGGVPRCVDACRELSDCGFGELIDTEQFACIDGACTYVGCATDAQCHEPGKCIAAHDGIRECAFPCETADDCAKNAQQELGLDGPDPNDPFTHADGFVCLQGVCFANVPDCATDSDCGEHGSEPAVCRVPE